MGRLRQFRLSLNSLARKELFLDPPPSSIHLYGYSSPLCIIIVVPFSIRLRVTKRPSKQDPYWQVPQLKCSVYLVSKHSVCVVVNCIV